MDASSICSQKLKPKLRIKVTSKLLSSEGLIARNNFNVVKKVKVIALITQNTHFKHDGDKSF